MPDSISIRLLKEHQPRSIVVSGSGDVAILSDDHEHPIETLRKRERFTITTDNRQLLVEIGDHAIYALSIQILQPLDEEIGIEVVERNVGRATRTYRGSIQITPDPSDPSILRIINHVGVEDYVMGVLAKEFNFRKEPAATQAMAIAARTQAYRALRQNGPAFELPDNDTWQVYGGNEGITKTIVQSVNATQGLVLTYNGDLIEAVYSASSGGHTANNEDVWDASTSLPYLRGQQDPYDENAPYHTWNTRIPRLALHRALGDALQYQVRGIEVMNRSQDGRAQTMTIIGPQNDSRTLSGNNFRLIANRAFGSNELKSTLFQLSSSGADYVFRGNGFGHGVGLNQWGAHEMSKRGANAQEILAFYYPNTVIESFDQTRERFITYNNSNYGYGVRSESSGTTSAYQDDRYTYSQSASQPGRTVSYSEDAWLDDEYERTPQANWNQPEGADSGFGTSLREGAEKTGNWFTRLFPRRTSNDKDEPALPSSSEPTSGGSSDIINQVMGEGGDAGSSSRVASQSGNAQPSNSNGKMKGWSSTKEKADKQSSSSSKRTKRTKRIGW